MDLAHLYYMGVIMKYFFLSLMFTLLSAVSFSSSVWAQISQDIASLNLENGKTFEDFGLPSFYESSDQLKSNLQLYRQIIETLTNNAIRSPENRALTQAEANLLVKYFLHLKLDPEKLLSLGFQANLNIPNTRDKAQAIQVISNIANLRKDMDHYLVLGNVKCFFRNYKNPYSFEDIKVTESLDRDPLTKILNRSDEATIVGKCRGCGLLRLPEFSMTEDQSMKYPVCGNQDLR